MGEKVGIQNLTIVGSEVSLDVKKINGQKAVEVDEGELIFDGNTKIFNLN